MAETTTTNPTQTLLFSIINAVLIPELVNWLRHRTEATGKFPTEEEILAKRQADCDSIISAGAVWAATHPDPNQPLG